MELNRQTAEIYIPDNVETTYAIARTTHMAIGAHQDDLEIMAYHGIEECFQSTKKFFFGCVVTNGSGSARNNIYENYTNDEMMVVRKKEQKKAASIGEYGALALLDYESFEVKQKDNAELISELVNLITLANPEVIYTHNLADKHQTHVAIVINVIKAIRALPKEKRPKLVYGCEIWRSLDWVNDDEKIYLDVSGHPNLASSLVEVFDSQIIGGKRYDLATIGRRKANATFSSSHEVDTVKALTYAIDLTKLTMDEELDILEYIEGYVERFKESILDKVREML